MPVVAQMPGRIRVLLPYNDHDPPHFHVEGPGVAALLRLADLSLLRGSLGPRDLVMVRDWARAHQAELALNWVLARAKFDLREIPFP